MAMSDEEFAKLQAEFEGKQDSGLSDEEFAALQAEFEPSLAPAAKSVPSLADTVSRKAVQGASFGFGDEIGGGMQSVISSINKLFGGQNPYETDQQLLAQGFTGDLQPSAYDAGLQFERDRLVQMSEARPVVSALSEGAGMLVTTPLMGPVAGAVTQGLGSGEGVTERLGGAAIGAAAVPVLGAAGKGISALASREGAVVAPKIASGAKNLYKAVTNHTNQMDVPVLEAMSRQLKTFRGKAFKSGAQDALNSVDNQMIKLNKELSDITKVVSQETQGDMLSQFTPVSDSLREVYEMTGNKNLLRISDQMDEAILSGDYEKILDVYKNTIKKNRVYDNKTGALVKYKGDTNDAMQIADDLFMGANNQFLDDTFRVLDLEGAGSAAQFGDQFRKNMSELKDLHLINNHLEKSSRVGREGLNTSGLPTTAGAAVGATIGGSVAGPVGAGIGGAVGAGAGALQRSVVAQNAIFKFKDLASNNVFGPSLNATRGVLNRSVDGVNKLVETMGGDLLAEGANPVMLSTFSKAMASGGGPVAEQAASAIMNQFPKYFEDNGYVSEVNGRVTDPTDVEIERAKITNSTQGNIIERAKALSGLNKDGSIYRGQTQPVNQQVPSNNPLKRNQESVNNAQEIDRLFKNQGK